MRCSSCNQQIDMMVANRANDAWQKLFNYFEHELCEDEITEKTFASLTDALSVLDPRNEDVE